MKNREAIVLIIVIISMVVGASIIIFQDKILSGLVVLFGGSSLGLVEILGWLEKLNNWLRLIKINDDEEEEQKPLVNTGTYQHIQFGDHAQVTGPVNIGGRNQVKK